ncbi:MAG: ABC transporter permease [Actinobacteria bacterium]|nr:ABC transporter permease [Actinomycetota bacterium]NDC91225.1 ABC transporter permease [Acidimicrobiia bacterium]NDD72585.1 ABC transporter permease [Actinomycetota bacterium]
MMKDLIKSLRYTFLALVASLLVGAIIIVVTDIDALKSGDYGKAFSTVFTAYKSLFEGSLWSLRSISNTITGTTPLLLSGLAVSVAFKAGLFNIGATGQMLAGGMTALWVGFVMSGPGWLQVPLAVLAGAIGGALYGGVAGVLKARTGAHEVITTIMLNSIASFLVLWLLKTTTFQREGRPDPISKLISDEAHLPRLFGFLDGRSDLVAHSGFFVALLATYAYWYLLKRTTLGFELRATGLNSDAAKYAGMKSKSLMVVAMLLAGGFAGMAGATEVLGTYGYASTSLAGNIGFDAIAVALLGQSSPIGTLVSALLFGALQAGGRSMQANTDVPVDLIIVLRALIVMFVAAPLLVKAMFRVKSQVTAQGQTFRGWGG